LGAGVSIGRQPVKWDMDVTNYRGAGTYPPIDVSLTVGGHGYFAESTSQITVRVSPDFSTTLTFSGLQEDGTGPGTISGTIGWTCLNAA